MKCYHQDILRWFIFIIKFHIYIYILLASVYLLYINCSSFHTCFVNEKHNTYFLTNFNNFLHYMMTITSYEVMKYDKYLARQLNINITALVSRASAFTCHVTIFTIFNFFKQFFLINLCTAKFALVY